MAELEFEGYYPPYNTAFLYTWKLYLFSRIWVGLTDAIGGERCNGKISMYRSLGEPPISDKLTLKDYLNGF